METNALLLLELINCKKGIDVMYSKGLLPSQIADLTDTLLKEEYIRVEDDYSIVTTDNGIQYLNQNRHKIRNAISQQTQLYCTAIDKSVIYLPRRL